MTLPSWMRPLRTAVPDMTLIGQKPFLGMPHHELYLRTGFVSYWYSGEWFNFTGVNDSLGFAAGGLHGV